MAQAIEQAGPVNEAEEVSHVFVSRAVYGLITVLAVLQLMESHPPSAWRGAISLFGTTLVVALVDTYSETIAGMLAHGRRLTSAEVRRILHDVGPVLIGAQGPTLMLILAGLGLIEVETAIDLAQVVAFFLLFGYGWRIGKLLHEQRSRQAFSGLILVAIGGIIVGIKAAFH